MQEVVLFYNGLDVPTRQILDSRGAIPSKTTADAKVAIQEMAKYSQKWHNGTSRIRIRCEQCKRPHYTKDCPLKEQGKTLEEAYYTQFGGPFQGGGYRAIAPASTDASIRNQGASIKTLEIQIGKIGKVLQERGFGSLPSSTEINPRDQVKSILTTIKVDASSIRRIGSSQYAVSTGQNSILMYDARQTIILFLIHLNDCYYDDKKGRMDCNFWKLALKLHISINPYPERRKTQGVSLYLAILIMFALIMPLSLDPLNRDYIELNDLNVPIELRRDQVDDLMPTIKEGGLVEEFRARNDARMISDIIGYPSEQVLEDVDDYRDEGMGDVIFGEPFLREVRINARRFDEMITIYNGNDEVTYQMVRSHPRIKHHTNEQCNNTSPLLKVSDKDKMNGISHPYQKLKGFYKGVSNLGPEFVRDLSMEEYLTCGHISVHEMQ
ncbi:hypothetical protein Tco_1281960 [Tanacetum coccineum]